MYRADKAGRTRILRSVYECGVFQTLREKLRCKEIWVVGADRWRNPDEDLPADFETNRAETLCRAAQAAGRRQVFVAELRDETGRRAVGTQRRAAAPGLAADRRRAAQRGDRAHPAGRGARTASTCAGSRPPSATGGAWCRCWTCSPRPRCAPAASTPSPRSACAATSTRPMLFERLLLVIYAYGTNTGIRAVAAGDHPHTEDDLRYMRRRYLTVEGCRADRPRDRQRHLRRPPIAGCGARAAPPSRRTRPTSRRSTRTSSPSGTPATAAPNAVC